MQDAVEREESSKPFRTQNDKEETEYPSSPL
jgi:hypothetical protein